MSDYQDEDRCPNCHCVEDTVTKTVCNKCGYEYEEEDDIVASEVFIALLILVVFIYLFSTIFWWCVNDDSLLQVIKNQWNWIKGRKVW